MYPRQSWKTAAFLSFGVALFFYLTQVHGNEQTAIEAISATLFMFAIAFFTMRITSRMVGAAVTRWGPKPPPPPERGAAVTEPTSERFEHHRRRRERRRDRRR